MRTHKHRKHLNEKLRIGAEKDTAIKILDGIKKLKSFSEKSKRRWIWELMQNAKDVSQGQKLKIHLTLTANSLEFAHNGRPFCIDNIIFLIRQTSTKERVSNDNGEEVNPETTGRYGTGFLTTHLLSKVVEVQGVYFDPDPESVAHQKFSLHLDRSANNLKDMNLNLSKAFSIVDELDAVPSEKQLEGYQSGLNCDTKFIYQLSDNHSKKVALEGLQELEAGLPYVFAFLPNLEEVVIQNQLENSFSIYDKRQIKKQAITKFEITKKNERGELVQQIQILTATDGNLTAALEYKLDPTDNTYFISPLNPNISCIFVDFPLIGSQELEFPLVLNSHDFEPNEAREMVFLDQDGSARTNKLLFQKSLKLMDLIFQEMKIVKGVYRLCHIPYRNVCNIVDENWFVNSIQTPLRKYFMDKKIVETNSGEFTSIRKIIYFFDEDSQKLESFRQIVNPIYSNSVPKNDKIINDFWLKCIDETWKNNHLEVTRKPLISLPKFISGKFSIGELLGNFPSKEALFTFLNELLCFFSGHTELFALKIFPDQNGVFRHFSELSQDNQIPEEIKDIAQSLNIKIRESLLHSSVNFPIKTKKSIVDIMNIVNTFFPKKSESFSQKNIEHSLTILRFIPSEESQSKKRRECLYSTISKILPMKPKIEIGFDSPKIWEQAEFIIFSKIVHLLVYEIGSLSSLHEKYPAISGSDFMADLLRILPVISGLKIFPNQLGDFCLSENLKSDHIQREQPPTTKSPAEVREILLCLSKLIKKDARQFLLDQKVERSLESVVLSPFKTDDICHEINEFIENPANRQEENSPQIYSLLKLLEDKYSFTPFEFYNSNKSAMMFSFLSPERKKKMEKVLSQHNANAKIDLIADLSDNIFDVLKSIDLTEKNTINILLKLSQMDSLKLTKFSEHVNRMNDPFPQPRYLSIPEPKLEEDEDLESKFSEQLNPFQEIPAQTILETHISKKETQFILVRKNTKDGLKSSEAKENFENIKFEDIKLKDKSDSVVEAFITQIKNEPLYEAIDCKIEEGRVVSGIRKHEKKIPVVVVQIVDSKFTITDQCELRTLRKRNSELWGVANGKLKRIKTGPLIEKNGLVGKILKI